MTVLIAGGGPAGSSLAEVLARNGFDVTLIEQLDSPQKLAFSSAAVPISSVYENWIPMESISTYWNKWQIFDPDGNGHIWNSNKNLGVVLDFGNLRKYLWKRAENAGVRFFLGWKVSKVISYEKFADVEIRSRKGSIRKIQANIVVDATGYRRSLLGPAQSKYNDLLTGNGNEWILKTDSNSYNKWASSLSFFIGSQWVKNGYGWIFPMARNRLKVGICRLQPNNKLSSNISKLKSLIYKNGLQDSSVLDKHGGVISSTISRSEHHYNGRIIGVGDAISTSNLLGGEGIRHALNSSRILSSYLLEKLNKNGFNTLSEISNSKRYENELRKLFGWKWKISNKIAKNTWWGLSTKVADEKMKKKINLLEKHASAEDLSSLLFDYNFGKHAVRLIPYLIGFR